MNCCGSSVNLNPSRGEQTGQGSTGALACLGGLLDCRSWCFQTGSSLVKPSPFVVVTKRNSLATMTRFTSVTATRFARATSNILLAIIVLSDFNRFSRVVSTYCPEKTSLCLTEYSAASVSRITSLRTLILKDCFMRSQTEAKMSRIIGANCWERRNFTSLQKPWAMPPKFSPNPARRKTSSRKNRLNRFIMARMDLLPRRLIPSCLMGRN